MYDDKRLQEAFLEEVLELLDNLNKQLLLLEDSPTDKDVINEIFRMTHSIKSESALVGFKNMSTISHRMEDIFERVRRGILIVDRHIMDVLFAAFDRIMSLITAIQNGENENSYDISDVVDPMALILNEEKPADSKKETTPSKVSSETVKQEISNADIDDIFSETDKSTIEDSIDRGEKFYKIVYHIEDECDMKYPRAYLVYNNLVNLGNVLKTVPDILMETEDNKFGSVTAYFLGVAEESKIKECADVDQVDKIIINNIGGEILRSKLGLNITILDTGLSESEVQEAEDIEKEWAKQLEEQTKKEEAEKKAAEKPHEEEDSKKDTIIAAPKEEKKAIPSIGQNKEIQKQTVRVDIERLDMLMNLVGELIINRSRFVQIKDKLNEHTPIQEIRTELDDATNELERITDQMQMGMMQARMVPIGNVFSKFPRMVRDLANSIHKNVNLEITGETTEIDRTVIELIAEPLTHLIRNSIDHGIEEPEEREKAGKPKDGRVGLKAYQEGSSIYIEVSDDGKGLNVESIREKAIEKGLVTQQIAATVSTAEILNYIFEPGFSTKKEVTSLSGRGVGMDVVKTQIEKLRGRVDISTNFGLGTKFTIVLPLTLTIVEALLVNVDSSIFAIPIAVVEETIKVKRDEIKEFDDYQVYNLRNETLAVIFLSDLVGLNSNENIKPTDDLYIVVVAFDRRKIGLVVTNLIGEQDIVIKALDEVLKNNDGIAGASVLGDGKVALILDTSTLVKAALREINKLAEKYDFYSDENKITNISKLYDDLNDSYNEITERKNRTAEKDAPKEVEPEKKKKNEQEELDDFLEGLNKE